MLNCFNTLHVRSAGTDRVCGAIARCLLLLLATWGLGWLSGCASHVANRNLVGGVVSVVMAHVPTSQLQQVYYLGVFDPQEQIPPTIYRIRVQAQGSALNRNQYASGWVHANLIDSLSGKGQELLGNGEKKTAAAESERSSLVGRRLYMFGPEGFREAPKNHRLVVVMGSDPSAFFGAMDRALGVMAEASQGVRAAPQFSSALLAEMTTLDSENKALGALLKTLEPTGAPK